MAWDSSRPVPWQRLMREWVIYALIMTAVLAFFFRDNVVGAIAGILISGPLYLALGAVLAKFGYQRKTLGEIRAEATSGPEPSEPDPAATRTRPPPTSRTSTGSNRPKSKRRR